MHWSWIDSSIQVKWRKLFSFCFVIIGFVMNNAFVSLLTCNFFFFTTPATLKMITFSLCLLLHHRYSKGRLQCPQGLKGRTCKPCSNNKMAALLFMHFSEGHIFCAARKDETYTRTRSCLGPDKTPGDVLGLTMTFQSKLQTRPKGVVATGSPYNTPVWVQMPSWV